MSTSEQLNARDQSGEPQVLVSLYANRCLVTYRGRAYTLVDVAKALDAWEGVKPGLAGVKSMRTILKDSGQDFRREAGQVREETEADRAPRRAADANGHIEPMFYQPWPELVAATAASLKAAVEICLQSETPKTDELKAAEQAGYALSMPPRSFDSMDASDKNSGLDLAWDKTKNELLMNGWLTCPDQMNVWMNGWLKRPDQLNGMCPVPQEVKAANTKEGVDFLAESKPSPDEGPHLQRPSEASDPDPYPLSDKTKNEIPMNGWSTAKPLSFDTLITPRMANPEAASRAFAFDLRTNKWIARYALVLGSKASAYREEPYAYLLNRNEWAQFTQAGMPKNVLGFLESLGGSPAPALDSRQTVELVQNQRRAELAAKEQHEMVDDPVHAFMCLNYLAPTVICCPLSSASEWSENSDVRAGKATLVMSPVFALSAFEE